MSEGQGDDRAVGGAPLGKVVSKGLSPEMTFELKSAPGVKRGKNADVSEEPVRQSCSRHRDPS